MNLKKMWKRFWNLNVHNHEGFTLVELIIVIAILAILSGVAVVGYSSYIKKANIQADRTVISEVKNAMELYYYSSNDAVQMGYVVLGQGRVVEADDFGKAAMQAAYGDNWPNVGLQWAGWKGESSTLSYANSSYYGKESSLITKVDSLTSALGNVVENENDFVGLVGTGFNSFLQDYEVDVTNGKEVGNAAVLYVAQNTQGKEAQITAAINTAISKGATSPAGMADNMFNELIKIDGLGSAAAMAVVYAYAEGYAQATGKADKFNPDFSDVSGMDAMDDALVALGESFNDLGTDGFSEYVSTKQGEKDLKAYIDMMGTVNNNADVISGNLNADDCFTDGTVEGMLKGLAAMSSLNVATQDGQVAIVLVVNGDGTVTVHVTPLNWNK